jgi:hypothetical protein
VSRTASFHLFRSRAKLHAPASKTTARAHPGAISGLRQALAAMRGTAKIVTPVQRAAPTSASFVDELRKSFERRTYLAQSIAFASKGNFAIVKKCFRKSFDPMHLEKWVRRRIDVALAVC